MNNGVQITEYKDKKIGYYGGKFLPFHKGHLSCIIQASTMVDILFVVVCYDNDYDKSICENTKFKWVSSNTRERWITESLKDFKNIRVLTHHEPRFENYLGNAELLKCNRLLLEKLGGRIDYVFSSELEYEQYFKEYLPKSKHLIIDSERKLIDISATKIRNGGVYSMWEYLPDSVKKDYIKRVCICGIESTGKSYLTKQLATLYNTNFVTEYGRDFYERIGGCFDIMRYEDFIKIAMGHNHLIEKAIHKSDKVIFIDTDNIYTQFFMKEEYGVYDPTIDAIIKSEVDDIDLYIYLEPSLPHELDGMRQLKTDIDKIEENRILKTMYKNYGKDLKIIKSVKNLNEIKKLVNDLIK